MKIALVTTTINVPHVLRLYRRCDPDVRFFVAVEQEMSDPMDYFLRNLPNTQVCRGEEWKCSELIGWRKIQRRNVAILDALKWDAELIVTVDDDNGPLSESYFHQFCYGPGYPTFNGLRGFNGLMAHPENDWFDVGQLYTPAASQRGFPHAIPERPPRFSHVVDAQIGVHAGLVIGDPDISAMTRITRHPNVTGFHEALRHGVAVNPRHTRTIFNSQNTAYIRELAPAMLLCPQFKRYDDIVASLVCQRVMCETGHHVLHAPPICLQERNAHDLQRDLDDEQWGQANILRVQEALWDVGGAGSIQNIVENCYLALDDLMPGVAALATAWLEDCERAVS